MATRWDPSIEHVFNSGSITSIMNTEYPAVYKLMYEELESTSAYLGLTAKMKSVPFRWVPVRSSGQDEFHLIQSVSKCLEQDLPQKVREKIGRAIVDNCSNSLPSLSAIPPGKPCMISSRINGIDDANNTTIFWSCGVDLNLFEGDLTSTRSPSKSWRLEGSFNLAILACNRGILDKIEDDAGKDYLRTKGIIMQEFPRIPLFPSRQSSIQGNHRSTASETGRLPRPPSGVRRNEHTDERLSLRSAMDSIPDSAVSILKIQELKESQLSADGMVALRNDIKFYINDKLHIPTAFIVQDHVIIVYPRTAVIEVTKKLHDFNSDGHYFADQSRTGLSLSIIITHQELPHGAKYDDVMQKVS